MAFFGSAKISSKFGLRKQKLSVVFDYSDLTAADMTSRINNWRIAIMSMIATPNQARIDLGWKPAPDAGTGFCQLQPGESYAGRMATISNVFGSMIKS